MNKNRYFSLSLKYNFELYFFKKKYEINITHISDYFTEYDNTFNDTLRFVYTFEKNKRIVKSN